MNIKHFLILFFCLLLILACAKRGTPTGGFKDTIPPILINASPKNKTTFFDSEKITLTFNEYIKLNDINKQLIISPPIEANKFKVEPQSNIAKKIKIEFNDSLSLKSNTTYTFNFGSSIEDNNESNILPFFSYTLSTGEIIDSLSLKGRVEDAFDDESEKFVSLHLYPIDSTHTDSIIFNSKPLYAVNTLDTLIYNFQNLREDNFQIIALKDYNNNYYYDQGIDKIGFTKDTVYLPGDSIFNFRLFKENYNFNWDRPEYVNDHHIRFGYFGTPEEDPIKLITPVPENFKTLINKEPGKDTLNFWFPEIEADSLQFSLKTKDSIYNVNVNFYRPKPDSLIIKPVQTRIIELNDTLKFKSNLPLEKFNENFIKVQNIDSMPVKFDLMINENYDLAKMFFKLEPNDEYTLSILPNAFQDLWGNTNDTILLVFSTRSYDSYGEIKFQLDWKISEQAFILELINTNNDVVQRINKRNEINRYSFKYLVPGTYKARIILDNNANGKWDSGNYFKKIQPERVIYLSNELELRANWELNEVFIVK